MAIYENIAAYYDHIFVHSGAKTDFVIAGLTGTPAGEVDGGFLLDIGCGTGELVIDLARRGAKAIGIDGEARMIDYAKEKAAKLKIDHPTIEPPKFIRMDMRTCGSEFAASTFDGISCLGNTLVHLRGEVEITAFLAVLRTLLNPAGVLTLQIVNYRLIFDTNRHELPVIDNDVIRFERYYDFEQGSDSLDFRTVLEIKASGQRIESTSVLYPIRQDRLVVLLEDAGFVKINLFENFQDKPFAPESMSVLIRAHRV